MAVDQYFMQHMLSTNLPLGTQKIW